MKTILHLPAWYPHDNDPLLGTFVHRHIEAVSAYGRNIVVFVYPVSDRQEKFFIEKRENNGIVEFFGFYRNTYSVKLIGLLLKPIRFLRLQYKLYRTVVNAYGRPDLVHVHVLTRNGFVAWLIKKRFNIPYVITEHWSRYKPEANNYHGWIRKKITQKVVKAAAAVMPVTHDLKRVMQSRKLINKKYTVIGNVVDTALFTPRKKPLAKRYFVHVSTFGDDVKNITGMLRVVKKIKEQRTDFFFYIIGTGEDDEAIKAYAKQIGLSDETVCFKGPMQKHEVAEQMKNAMFLVMFSNYENMPVVICEAMACGIPVISSRVGGIDEVVDEKRGILIQPKDEKGLYEAINIMLDNNNNYNADYIREKALINFSVNSVGKRIISIYESVITGHV